MRFDTGEPGSGQELAQALSRLTLEGGKALGTLPVDVFFTPQGAKWSPAEHARHLQRSSAPLVIALRLPAWLLRLRFGRPRRASRGFVQLRSDYRAVLDAGGQAGRFAPPAEVAPQDPDSRRGQILTQWYLTNSRFTQLLGRWRESRLDSVQLPHPLLGMLTLREMAAFTVYHTSHHLTLVMERATGRT
ncbi:MAG: DinB family protein [Gemmatimonadaceae bacterium]